MNPEPPAQAIEDGAADWAVRIDAGNLTAEQQAAFDAWLAANARHEGAYLRARAALRWLDQAQVAQSVLPLQPAGASAAEVLPAPARASAPWARRRVAAMAGMLAGAVIAAVLGFVLLQGPPGYGTAVGEQRRITLDDRSVAMINTDSRLEVEYAARQRMIRLAKGEAWFQVARDHSRPFIVDAGRIRVRATGTAFSVRRRGEAAQVVVTEGRVLAWIEGEERVIAVKAGQQALLSPTATRPAVATAVRADDVLAWRKGEIILGGETIGTAAEEFNRYNARKIRIENPRIAGQRIIGYFLIDQSLQFATAASGITGASVSEKGNEIVIQ